ncbi:inositol monophosphatase [Pelagibius sp. Alg239-R121]|uniref:inositol monophosphatase family protein n=1 Tax=Pelagibius sp. Alg239-R121 TaxID=2993448 RepID=UPI0024A6BD99|nr:inositol monophosphatase [Pelagibius sp. Alg239-R121]
MIDVDRITKIIKETADEEVLPRFQKLKESEVSEKAHGEVVTIADTETERVLTDRLSAALPGSHVVGEESVSADPAVMDLLEGPEPVWIIDPIDGTSNFASGKPVFAVMVALVVAGETRNGWIHDPIGARSLTAEQGGGAWIGAERVSVRDSVPALDMSGTLHASQYALPDTAAKIKERRSRVQAIPSLRCAGHEYFRLATAEMHFSLFTRLMPWDHVAGCLIQEEAGGVALCFDGTPYSALRHREKGLMIAPSRDSWQDLYRTLLSD